MKTLLKSSLLLAVLWLSGCNQSAKTLTSEEKEQIKEEVIASIEKHFDDIINLDYDEVMKAYVKEEFFMFGDGDYWGDYATIDDIWKTWLPRWMAITKWELLNHKVKVYSRNEAVDFFVWDHERIEEDGDTTKAYGFFVLGMERFPEGWKCVNMAVDHRYTAGPNVRSLEDLISRHPLNQ